MLLDGESVKSCTVLAAQADGHAVTTIEGLAADGDAAPDAGGVPRAPRAAVRLLHAGHGDGGGVARRRSTARSTEAEVRIGLEGNLCRCTGYHNIVKAVLAGADAMTRPGAGRVIPAAFAYARADSVDEAIALLAEHGDDAKLLAGGHSLLPLMKLRLATPSVLVDVGRLARPRRTSATTATTSPSVGSPVTTTSSTSDAAAPSTCRCSAAAAGEVGDPQVRHRGTLGGSLAHGDPASDLPAVVLALGGTIVVAGPGRRARRSPPTTSSTASSRPRSRPTSCITEVRVPKTDGAGWAFEKFNRRAQDWAIVGVAAVGGDGPAWRW